ncbi:HlyD family efflux transporter periplasmic adaptor subunit [Oricola sp.]|uniref:HlyD family efflux transporter periplasmic adaptor subunit n=1 Tax=Oricola sp. TaxID=1979950 RepID=UPI0025EC9194|nr:HlyD family efflux transporter periplasmic adaptor subunit [Oricola sp.]MCI5077666.1 HlyD family efflux transporter periplasmic adaptor subunit [Oricola sp.]
MRRIVILLILVVAAGSASAWWWQNHDGNGDGPLVLYGNVDLRQIDLAFIGSGRIAEVLVDEGAAVEKGDIVARLDTSLIEPQVAQAEAGVAAQAATVEKLQNGSRPEEIAQAEANVDAARANARNASLSYDRAIQLQKNGSPSVTQSQIDSAKAAEDAATAQLKVAEQALILAQAGPRAEDIAAAQAQLKASEAALDLLRRQLDDAELVAPAGGVIRSRLLEPGEMASAAKPVVSIAIVDPKWVRAYISEPDLPKVAPGAEASVTVDGHDEAFAGSVGFISSVAEFTPHAIQTEELRTSLVYEVRILVEDKDDILRLGMPATVTLTSDETAQ